MRRHQYPALLASIPSLRRLRGRGGTNSDIFASAASWLSQRRSSAIFFSCAILPTHLSAEPFLLASDSREIPQYSTGTRKGINRPPNTCLPIPVTQGQGLLHPQWLSLEADLDYKEPL